MNVTAVILAAGLGTRMKSSVPKVLHPLLGRPMISYSVDAARQVTGNPPVVVIGHAGEQVRSILGEQAEYVLQEPQLGTAHAVMQAEELLKGKSELVLVTTADMPLIRKETLNRIVAAQKGNSGPLTMLTVISDESRGFGRVIRDELSQVLGVVEEAQASAEQLAIRELNTSVYCFSSDWLWEALKKVSLSSKGEYYLTDLVGIAVSAGDSVLAMVSDDQQEAIGINTRVQLAEAEKVLRRRINQAWMLAGVTLVDPDATYIEEEVAIGQDSVIWPNTYLRGKTLIGKDCVIGPNAILQDTQIGDRCHVLDSVLESASVEDDVGIGPYGHLRKGAHLASGVHMGNFGEVKSSYLGPGVKMGHFSYIGDATIGAEVNIGAGTITCNFDGERKNHTEIGAGAFIGSDTMLIAPITIGENARTGAGAVVTKDIPADTLAVGMPARAIRKLKK
jgi:bifunctional UDP-N-acetylglucosamine pyrophosphorylase/glucosamine-1-phosphate N-acetyltransferase